MLSHLFKLQVSVLTFNYRMSVNDDCAEFDFFVILTCGGIQMLGETTHCITFKGPQQIKHLEMCVRQT